MHVGCTTGAGLGRPFLQLDAGGPDGAVAANARVAGCYVHGLFACTAVRSKLIGALGAVSSGEEHASAVDAALDEIAATLESCLDIDALMRLAGLGARVGAHGARLPG